MIRARSIVFAFLMALAACLTAMAQTDDFCSEFGEIPSLDSPFAHVPYVFGMITLTGFDPAGKLPIVSLTLVDRNQTNRRLTIKKSGKYCFKRTSGSSGSLVLEIDGVEVERRMLPPMGPAHQREDFEILSTPSQTTAPPGTVSAKFNYPQSEEAIELYKKAAAAEKAGDLNEAVKFVKEIVQVDPANFIAWAKLGSLYLDQKSYSDANTALRKSLELKVEYTPAWILIGQLRVAQKQYEAAIEIFKHAAGLEPESAWTFQLLGEAYLQAKQGTLGAQALNHAIRLDPMGMAEVHLQLAHLFQLAKANKMAADEYRKFLEKRPDHPDRKKFEKFIRENPR